MDMDGYFDGLWLPRLFLQRGLAAIYLVAFVSALRQFPALLGERGLLPVPRFLARVSFLAAPSLFHARYSDTLMRIVAGAGIVLSVVALFGLSEAGPVWLSVAVWLTLWALYLSLVNVGQTFYAFGWESMLVEAGFFAAFLGPAHVEPPVITLLILRWMLFRVELGAGLIKIRHDPCWRDLTCLYYHHETQPMPNPVSWFAHRMPKPLHRFGVLFSHFVQLVAPFGLFAPQPIAGIAAALIIAHQLALIVSGNYAWLNWLTVVLAFAACSDAMLQPLVPLAIPELTARTATHDVLLVLLAGGTLVLSVQPALNFFSRDQRMNYNYNPLHLVNAYGAFGSVTRERLEVVLEGSASSDAADDASWRAYEVWGKPGDPRRRPPQVAPYHLRLAWLMWFLPLRAVVRDGRVLVPRHERWFLVLVARLFEGDERVRRLLRHDPFPDAPPRRIRARLYHYRFSDAHTRNTTGAWWTRTHVGDFLPAVSKRDLPF